MRMSAAAGEALGAGQQAWCSAALGSLQTAADAFTAVGASATEACQLGTGAYWFPNCKVMRSNLELSQCLSDLKSIATCCHSKR